MELKDNLSVENTNTKQISLDFAQLRDVGLSYIQQLSGDIWTDYNAHDPGVTILEQLCYALTDIAYRTSLPIQYFLAPFQNGTFEEEAHKNAFFAPSTILSSHPVTIADIRKTVINKFEKIENAWVTLKAVEGFQEQLRGGYKIEILPKQHFRNVFRKESDSEDENGENELLNKVMAYLSEIRNLGEDFSDVSILENQDIIIDFDIYITNETEIEKTVADLILVLYDFIYHPVHHYSFEEMLEAGLSVGEIFAGPKLDKGFIRNEELREKLTKISCDELQKLFLKVKGVQKCDVRGIKDASGSFTTELNLSEGKFFNIFHKKARDTDNQLFDILFERIKVFTIKNIDAATQPEKGIEYNKEIVKSLLEETWSKQHREYDLRSQDDFFNRKLKGYHKKRNEYHSIQHHFPIVYGIGKEKLPLGEAAKSKERKAQALQLKAYLLFFEKHLANHLSQLGNMNEFFNIFFKREEMKTYFTQYLDNVPEIELLRKNIDAINSEDESEDKNVFFRRKHRIYDHLLARFGEDLNELPWKIKHFEQFKGEEVLNTELLYEKSEFLKTLGGLNEMFGKSNYSSIKGEDFSSVERNPSGLEQLVLAKTGIAPRKRSAEMLSKDENEEGLYIVDHILLRNIFDVDLAEKNRDIQYGFSFRDQDGHPHLETKAKESWCTSAEKRIERIETFFRAGLVESNYIIRATKANETIENYDVVEYEIDSHKQKIIKEISGLDKELGSIPKDKRFKKLKEKLIHKLEGYSNIHIDDEFDTRFRSEVAVLRQQLEELTKGEQNVPFLKSYVAEFLEKIKGLQPGEIESNRENSKKMILASYSKKDGGEENLKSFFMEARRYIQLFDHRKIMHPRARWEELEKKREKGTANKVDQKRLVFQRKVNIKDVTELDHTDNKLKKEFEIIDAKYLVLDEDFFDLNISIVLPNTPKRFTDNRFKTYVADLIGERTPAHIANTILWLDASDMRVFEKEYRAWEELKFKNEKDPDQLIKAAFKIYRTIKHFRSSKLKREKELRKAARNSN